MKKERRHFLKNIFLAVITLSGIPVLLTGSKSKRRNIAGCAPEKPEQLPAVRGTQQSGNWSNAATWGGNLPGEQDAVLINAGHTIGFDMAEATVAGIHVMPGAVLWFHPDMDAILKSTANIVVEGKWQMQPSSAAIKHILRFTGIDERLCKGDGMDVIKEDIGLWVMGAGQLQLEGAALLPWTRSTGAIAAGANMLTLEGAVNWKPGDLICIVPTGPPADGAAMDAGFEERIIREVSGNKVTISQPTSYVHPRVNDEWAAEVMNLERNVQIEGEQEGRAHVFIRSTAAQKISYTAFRHLGPRHDKGGNAATELVAGRYGMHFHHCMDGSRGSLVEGCVIRDAGNHSYVPHISHGISFLNNIAYNVLETAFWWDPGDPTHDVLYNRNLVARCNFVKRSLNRNAENAPTFSSSGFAMNSGDGNICTNNVVVAGGQGDIGEGAAYNWEAVVNEGVWTFRHNLAHHCDNALRVWQNSTRNHVIEDFFAYYNGCGIFHGAYANCYTYNGGTLYGNPFILKAASANSNRVRVENLLVDGGGLIDNGIEVIHSPLPGDRPVLLRNVTIKGCRQHALVDAVAPEVHSIDLVHCNIEGSIWLHPEATQGETIRVQPLDGMPYQITKTGRNSIAPFAPAIWGSGKGLKAAYFNGADLSQPAFTRVDSNISFTEWSGGVHYSITGEVYSVRWTGYLLPQYTDNYTFYLGAGGGFRLWINRQLLADSWEEHLPGLFTAAAISLEAGKPVDIKLEYFNQRGGTGMGLLWMSKKQQLEYIPQSQLYAGSMPVEPFVTAT